MSQFLEKLLTKERTNTDEITGLIPWNLQVQRKAFYLTFVYYYRQKHFRHFLRAVFKKQTHFLPRLSPGI